MMRHFRCSVASPVLSLTVIFSVREWRMRSFRGSGHSVGNWFMMEPGSHDVIIAGGGVGGLTLAIQLARKKVNVLLIEKNAYPFHRVCGEYISMESWDYLRRCGIQKEQ